MESAFQLDRILLPVEDHGPLRSAKEGESCRIRIKIKTSLHPYLVSYHPLFLNQSYCVFKKTIFPCFLFSNKPHPAAIGPPLPHSSKNGAHKIEIGLGPGKLCECCSVATSVQWYAWGSSNPATPPSQAPSRLCQNCWSYWKKYGDLDVSNKNGAASTTSDDDPKNLTGGGSDGMSSRPNRIAAQGCGKVSKYIYIF